MLNFYIKEVSSSLLMKRTADVVHVAGDVCRHAPCLRKLVVSTVIYPLEYQGQQSLLDDWYRLSVLFIWQTRLTARTHTGPLNAGLRLLLPHKNVPLESMMPNCKSLLLDMSFITKALSGERIRLSSLQKWPTPNAANSLHGCSV